MFGPGRITANTREQRTFQNEDWSGKDLRNINLFHRVLNSINMSGADLSRVDIRHTECNAVNFTGAKLAGALMSFSELSDTIMDNADMSGLIAVNMELLRGSNKARNTILRGADLSGAFLARTDFTGSDLRDAKMDMVNIYGTTFKSAKMQGAILFPTSGRFFANLDLRGAELYHDDLADYELKAKWLFGLFLRQNKKDGLELGNEGVRHYRDLLRKVRRNRR